MGIFDKVKEKVDKSPVGSVGHKITDKYNDITGISDVREAQDKYDKAVEENTGSNGAAKAAMQGQIGATAVGANAAENTKTAAQTAGASKGAASALGEAAMNPATQNAVAGETEKAAKKNQEIVDNAAKDLEAAQADMNAKAELISKVGTTAGTAIGGAVGGPVGGMVGGLVGGLGTTGLNYANQKAAASDENLKRDVSNLTASDFSLKREVKGLPGYKSRIKKTALLHLLDEIKEEVENE